MAHTMEVVEPRGEVSGFTIEASRVTSGYDKQPYLRDVSFGVRPREVVAVLGANGAGKTTLIMTLAGHLKASAGQVLIHGQPAPRGMERRLREGKVALITQERSVFVSLTVKQNILLGGGTEAETLALFPELTDHVGRQVGLLSGGQQQMLAVARAICSRPDVILADELSLGLGPKIVDRLLAVLASTARERDVAVVIVEQHIHKALRVADRAYVLRRGRIALEGESAELLAEPGRVSELYL